MTTTPLPPEFEVLDHRFNYDHETGVFTWKNPVPRTRAKAGMVAGSKKKHGYEWLAFDGKQMLAHRAAWVLHFRSAPPDRIDHINGDRHDNRIVNLRAVDIAENNWNSHKKHTTKGCTRQPGASTYYALIRHRGKRIYLGSFKTQAEATQAYQDAAKRLRGEFHA